MPLRSRIHSSVVSTILEIMWLSTWNGGMATPVPASTARSSVMKFLAGRSGGRRARWRRWDRGSRRAGPPSMRDGRLQLQRPHGRQVTDGQLTLLDEAIDAIGTLAVEA